MANDLAYLPEISKRDSPSPYSGLPDPAFWNRAVASLPLFALDPMAGTALQPDAKISKVARIATAGSCFAQHIAARLQASGYTYFVTEEAPLGVPPAEAQARNYRVFSARYGNIYTARQLRQLIDRAYGRFSPVDIAWRRSDGRYVDPFRPRIEPDGFATKDEVVAAREEHLAAVRRLFEELDVFVFTLGLTEGWRATDDGAAFPLSPGVAGGTYDPAQYRFVNEPVEEVAEDLAIFARDLKAHNPRCRLILTVSPVPLVATYEKRHVLQSTVLSKAVLRVAAQKLVDARDDAIYFPSFEIITSAEGSSRYFESDLRSVNAAGVDHVMRVFFRHLTIEGHGDARMSDQMADMVQVEFEQQKDVVCDEEALFQQQDPSWVRGSSLSAPVKPTFWQVASSYYRQMRR